MVQWRRGEDGRGECWEERGVGKCEGEGRSERKRVRERMK